MKLPPLREDERFSEKRLYDENWEVYGVELEIVKGRLRLRKQITVDQVYYSIHDQLRQLVENMLVEIRATAGDDA